VPKWSIRLRLVVHNSVIGRYIKITICVLRTTKTALILYGQASINCKWTLIFKVSQNKLYGWSATQYYSEKSKEVSLMGLWESLKYWYAYDGYNDYSLRMIVF
jgi:hypothetical protein